MNTRPKLLLVNSVFVIVGLVLFFQLYVLIFGFWGRGPFITEQLFAFTVIMLYALSLYTFNYSIAKGQKVLSWIKSFFSRLKENSYKSPIITSLIAFILVLMLVNIGSWTYFYIIPKHSLAELENISIVEWKGLSKREKFRIGQSFYIAWKGTEAGFHNANNYINLIEQDISRGSSYKNVGHIVFYSLSGV